MTSAARHPFMLALILTAAALAASLAVWGWAVARWMWGRPLIAYEPRRPVPWHAVDVAVVALFYWLVALSASFQVGEWVSKRRAEARVTSARSTQPTADHPVVVLLREDRRLSTLAWCFLAVVVVAPLAEELFFRLVVQGWFERIERHGRRWIRWSRGRWRGLLPIVASSLLFAWPHTRTSQPPLSPPQILHILLATIAAEVVTVMFMFGWMRVRVGAILADFGFVREKFWSDVRLGLLAAVAVLPWTYMLHIALARVMPAEVAPDSLTLTPFAMVLGLLYYRTHRIVAPIVLHMALNGTTLAMAWWMLAPPRA